MLLPKEIFFYNIFPLNYQEIKNSRIVKDRLFKPREDVALLSLSTPIDWESRAKKSDRNYRMQLQGWTMFHPLIDFFDEYNDKESIVDYFFDIIEDWYGHYGEDSNSIVTSRMPESYAWYGMSVGFRGLLLAFFLNRIEYYSIQLSSSKKELLQRVVIKHINHLKHKDIFLLNNHGIFQIHALMSLIQLLGVERYQKIEQYSLGQIENLITSQFDNRGVHREHSALYHSYILKIFKILSLVKWYQIDQSIWEIIEKAKEVEQWLVYPSKHTVSIGDSSMSYQEHIDFSIKTSNMEIVTEDKSAIYSDFNRSGYAIFRSNWKNKVENSSYLFFMGMYNSKVHKHRDCLSFEWFDRGKKIICDSFM